MTVKVIMPIIRDIIVESGFFGVDIHQALQLAGLTRAMLDDPDRWVELEQASTVWATVVELSGDPHLGLKIGQKANPHVIGIIGYLMESSPDLQTSVEQLCNFNAVFGNMFNYHFEERDSCFAVRYAPAPVWVERFPETARQAIETSMSRTIAIFRQFTGHAIWPLAARFTYPSPSSDQSVYRQILKGDLQFNQPENALLFDRSTLKLPLKSFNPILFKQFVEIAEKALQDIQGARSYQGQISRLLVAHAGDEWPTLDQVADTLNLTPRTLQRKLKTEGTSYKGVIDKVREELAEAFLSKEGTSILEIARFLGYTDATTFRRAFKRWKGQSPQEFRKL
jgi:AraC-like DNA-binding protein